MKRQVIAKMSVLIILIGFNAHIRANAQDSLLNEVDALLEQIDAIQQENNLNQTQKVITQKKDVPTAVGASARRTAAPLPVIKTAELEQAKHSIDLAEEEIAKLKESIRSMEAQGLTPKKENVQRIIRLNRGLLDTYDKTLDEYQAQGLKDSAIEIRQAKQGKKRANEEIEDWQAFEYDLLHGNSSNTVQIKQKKSKYVNPSYARSSMESREYVSRKPEESSYLASRNMGVLRHAHIRAKSLDVSAFKWTPFGDVEYEPFITTRQMVGVQGQQIYLIPAQWVGDALGQDVNAKSSFQLTYMHALYGNLIEGPEVLKAKPYVDFILEFFGPVGFNYVEQTAVNDVVASNGLLLVHSAIYLDWDCVSLIFGKAWHPWVDPEIQVSNQRVTTIGCLAEPLERIYQMRLTQQFTDNFELIVALLGKIDEKARTFINCEPFVLRNVPQTDLHLQLRAFKCDNIFAVGFDVVTDRPRLFDDWSLTFTTIPAPFSSENVFKSNAGVTSFSGFVFAKVAFENFTFRGKALVGSNIEQVIGGYAVAERSQITDANGVKLPPGVCYTPLRQAQVVADISMPKKIEPGLFFSFTKNLGASRTIYALDPAIYPDRTGNDQYLIFSNFPNLDYTLTISPRIKWHEDPLAFCGEIEFYRAAFGTNGSCGQVCCPVPVDNIRFIFSVQYYF
jgi:hypothetical protein